ncbi:MAG: DEAD/DEAH box helicase [Planctomycetota bacterium]
MPAIADPANSNKSAPRPTKVSRTHKPEHMDLRQWQVELRRQFGREQATEFDIRNLTREPVFSEFAVTNPATRRTYRVAVRGLEPGVNYCSCPDYAVNTLGTCKHIEAVLFRLAPRHANALRRGYAPPFAEVYVRYGARRAIVFSPGADCPAELRKLASRYFDRDGLLTPEAIAGFDRFVQDARKIEHELRMYDDAATLIAEAHDRQSRRERLQKQYGGPGRGAVWNRLLKVPPYPYQRDGALFAAQVGRSVIADEMGLGKTIQAIAAAEILAKDGGVERALIVCPSSLKSQWRQEIEHFSARTALVIDGPTHRRKGLFERDPAFFKIINYDVIHADFEAIAAWSPDLVILDEAQRIKNWQTRTAKSVKQIDSRFAVVLTGTPLENRLEELHSIVEFIDRHRLGPLFAFKAAHEVIEPGSVKVVGYRDLGRIHKTLAPILIRRTKKEVLTQLPPRADKNFFVPMTGPQWVPHRENQDIVARIVAKWRRYKFLTEADQLRLRIALQNMRMVCDSTYLIDHETKHGHKVPELEELLGEIFEDRAAKVVIFSQWVRMNELVIEMLERRRWGHVHLHGGVPSRDRGDLTAALREDERCRVFVSTDAGGVGLNLQSASTVINMDLPWNPAVLEQRIGRVHRLGQRNPVRVVNFIAEGAIEHGMLSLLRFKRSMFTGVLDGSTDSVSMGESALNRFMKTVETAASSAPAVMATSADSDTPQARGGGARSARAEAGRSADVGRVPDLRAMGDLLQQGAGFLQSLSKTLSQSGGQSSSGNGTGLAPTLVTNRGTGRSELHIPLPDEQVLRQWVALAGDALSALLGRQPATTPDTER